MYCKICGAALNPGDVFCKNCGASNNNQNNQQPVAPAVEPSQPMMNQEIASQPVPPIMEQPVQPQVAQPQPAPAFVAQPAFEPQQPIAQQPQPVFTPQEPVKNEDKESKSGKTLLIIGVVVGILALAVVVYLIIDSGILSGKKPSQDTGGTVVTIKNNYSVEFAGHKFTLDADYKATIDDGKLKIKGTNWEFVLGVLPKVKYTSLTEEQIRQTYATNESMTITNVVANEEATPKYWRMDYKLVANDKNVTGIFFEKAAEELWVLDCTEGTATSNSTEATITEIMTLIKNATVLTTSENDNVLGETLKGVFPAEVTPATPENPTPAA